MLIDNDEFYHRESDPLRTSEAKTGNVYDNDPHQQKSGIQAETERAIQRGLTDTARITQPWVTTSCTNQDVIKLIGNALHRDICGSDVPCLGFCSWNYVPGDQQPIEQTTTKSMPYEMRCVVTDVK
ncbi:unnamed protein product [Rotaria sordida]|uniref:TRPM SLOG domain-containing protein n=1 Tax=Rotaria sordida TaxID=392033 RepID=A0A814NRD8_9BILA|nr:unnamed protein product [Rotaria sordida]CAF1093931.1 unnamed protein product [Rotaria sordida]